MIGCCEDPVDIPYKSLHDLAQVLMEKSGGNPGEILSHGSQHDLVRVLVRSSWRGPCTKILRMRCLRGACMTAFQFLGSSWEVVVSTSCTLLSRSRSFYDGLVGIFLRVLAWRSWSKSFTTPCGKTLSKSWWNPVSLHDLVQVLVRRSCGDPVEILLKRSLH